MSLKEFKPYKDEVSPELRQFLREVISDPNLRKKIRKEVRKKLSELQGKSLSSILIELGYFSFPYYLKKKIFEELPEVEKEDLIFYMKRRV